MNRSTHHITPCLAVAICILWGASGCQTTSQVAGPRPLEQSGEALAAAAAPQSIPRELCKTILPAYSIEPPDILTIDVVNIVPRPPYHLRAMDAIALQVQGLPTDMPISGVYPIEPGGMVRLGPPYGTVRIAGMTVEQAEIAIRDFLKATVKEPVVTASLAEMASKQQIAGQHLVGPDGRVTLGSYGSVCVVGMTVGQAKAAIEQHLTQYLENPEISLDVFAYNSKVYYIVTQGAGQGDAVYRFPITGNETVLDAISQINGLNFNSSKKIWIARPTDDPCQVQLLPVEWDTITSQAYAATNYQLLPGDRLFVAEDKMVALDTGLAKFTAPFERIMGFSLLGVGTATRFSGPVLKGGGNANGSF